MNLSRHVRTEQQEPCPGDTGKAGQGRLECQTLGYLPEFNQGFSHPAREARSAFVPLICVNLQDYLCERYDRVVNKDNCVQIDALMLQPAFPTRRRGMLTRRWFFLRKPG
jgi:hypothetical protein